MPLVRRQRRRSSSNSRMGESGGGEGGGGSGSGGRGSGGGAGVAGGERRAVGSSVWEDAWPLFLLFVLYVLQGIPLGLGGAIPVILQRTGLGFGAKAVFSFAYWPYSLKLLWAPIVDSLWWEGVGRRKSWVVPTQFLIGLVLVGSGVFLDAALSGPEEKGMGVVWQLTLLFFTLTFLAATQDVAVDGWALTMLKPQNRGLASVCNSVGQIVGVHLASSLLLVVTDAQASDDIVREPARRLLGRVVAGAGQALLSPGAFLGWCGVVFVALTTLLTLFVGEKATPPATLNAIRSHGGWHHALHAAYQRMIAVLKLPHVQTLTAILLTCRVGFAAIDAGLDVELAQRGVSKSFLASLSAILAPVEILFSLGIAQFVTGPKPLSLWLFSFIPRILLALLLLYLINLLPTFPANPSNPFSAPSSSYATTSTTTTTSSTTSTTNSTDSTAPFLSSFHSTLLVVVFVGMRLCAQVMFVAQMGFFNRIADPTIGGTYMTLLNTLSNLGGMWPSSLALALMEWIEHRGCYFHAKTAAKVRSAPGVSLSEARANAAFRYLSSPTTTQAPPSPLSHHSCASPEAVAQCEADGGFCHEHADGFTIIVLASLLLAVLFLFLAHKPVTDIQAVPPEEWRVEKGSVEAEENEEDDEEEVEGESDEKEEEPEADVRRRERGV